MLTDPRLQDSLGSRFTAEEKAILRDPDQKHKKIRDELVVRLADDFTFRTAKRSEYFPWPWLEDHEDYEEMIDPTASCFQLPGRSIDLMKADYMLKKVSLAERAKPGRMIPIDFHVTAEEIKGILKLALEKWTRDEKDKGLRTIIDRIEHPEDIDKVICIGLGRIAYRKDPMQADPVVAGPCLAQHLAMLTMVNCLRARVSHKIELCAADFTYDEAHKAALESFGFTIFDPSRHKHEHFRMIDRKTMLCSCGIPPFQSIMPIISEYVQPAVLFVNAYEYQIDSTRPRPAISPVWSKVRRRNGGEDEYAIVLGPPKRNFEPFYTESTGRMFDNYELVMNIEEEFDHEKLPNMYGLHNHVRKPKSEDERNNPGCIWAKWQCLFVRKDLAPSKTSQELLRAPSPPTQAYSTKAMMGFNTGRVGVLFDSIPTTPLVSFFVFLFLMFFYLLISFIIPDLKAFRLTDAQAVGRYL
ncbi:hypothetical protein F5Y10DRAFT_196819 [Nemania abortiva]|nr:hypothetical protein F5Y10DRAFT_196819 [Nemania abortiva]